MELTSLEPSPLKAKPPPPVSSHPPALLCAVTPFSRLAHPVARLRGWSLFSVGPPRESPASVADLSVGSRPRDPLDLSVGSIRWIHPLDLSVGSIRWIYPLTCDSPRSASRTRCLLSRRPPGHRLRLSQWGRGGTPPPTTSPTPAVGPCEPAVGGLAPRPPSPPRPAPMVGAAAGGQRGPRAHQTLFNSLIAVMLRHNCG